MGFWNSLDWKRICQSRKILRAIAWDLNLEFAPDQRGTYPARQNNRYSVYANEHALQNQFARLNGRVSYEINHSGLSCLLSAHPPAT